MNGILNSYREKLKPFGHDNIDIFIQADPTGKKYVRWIVDSYVNGGIKRDEDLLSRVKPALEKYEYLKSRNILSKQGELWQQETNIDNYCGIVGCTKKGFEKPGLEGLIDKYKDQLEEEEQEETTNTAVQVYNGDTIRIIQPTTEADACYYGQSTRWCTAAKNDNMFNYYNGLGPLYIIIPKNPSYKDEKYQISFETRQYMDEKDDFIELSDLVAKYPEIEIGLQKYFLSLSSSDVSDPTTALYNADRAIVENNLDVLKEIMSRFPNIKPILENISSVEIFDYIVSLNIEIDGKDMDSIILKTAIGGHNNALFDRIIEMGLLKSATKGRNARNIALRSDNLYAFKILSDGAIIGRDILESILDGSPEVLEYVLDNLPSVYLQFITGNSILNTLDRRIESYSHWVDKTSSNIKTQKVVDVLDSKGFLDRNIVKKYIIDNNALNLLEFISFDSMTTLEITSTIENKMKTKMSNLKSLAKRAIE